MHLKFNLSEIFKWIDLKRLIFSGAITFIGIYAMYNYRKDLYTFFFTIKYFESITPWFQWIGFICVSYTFFTFISYIYYLFYSLYINLKYKNKNDRTWKSN